MGRPRRIRYTPEFKAEAVRLVPTTDRPINEIAKSLGVPRHCTLGYAHGGPRRPSG
jgi:transposase-like protein